MATLWTFPSKDMKLTAEAYHLALRDLSDEAAREATTALTSEWGNRIAPKPADILMKATEFRRTLPDSPRLPPRESSHEEIMDRIKRQLAPHRIIAEVLSEERRHENPKRWTAEERREISRRQAEARSARPSPP